MSMYHLVAGTDVLAQSLMQGLGISPDDVGRFRDCYLNEDGTQIIIVTRMGGGNRESYQEEIEFLTKHPLYLSNSDDDYDCTYAHFYFKVPEEGIEACKQYREKHKYKTMEQKFAEAIEAINNMPPTTSSPDSSPDSRSDSPA